MAADAAIGGHGPPTDYLQTLLFQRCFHRLTGLGGASRFGAEEDLSDGEVIAQFASKAFLRQGAHERTGSMDTPCRLCDSMNVFQGPLKRQNLTGGETHRGNKI